jgi:hypothetical protein
MEVKKLVYRNCWIVDRQSFRASLVTKFFLLDGGMFRMMVTCLCRRCGRVTDGDD